MFRPFKSSRLIRAASLAMGAVIIGGVAVVAAASAAAMIGFRPSTSAQADEATVTAAEVRVSSQACSDFMSHFAVEIGKTQAEINAAFQRAIADTLADEVKAGRLTQAQADAIKARLANRTPCALGGSQPRGAKLEAFMQQYVASAAAALGMTEAQLKTDLRSGQSLAQIAAAKKVSESDFRTRLIANLKPVLDKAVTNKRITSAQENAILGRLKTGPLPLWNRARNPKPAPAATPSAG
ncbi:MAG TPA: hypothetical protein VI172_10305 [Candidatus Dormibacteraeota bacterium]